MKTILEELYEGNIYPDEFIIPKNPEYRPLNQKISDTIKTLKERLSEDDYKQLEELLDMRCETSTQDAAASFLYGFKLGAVILIEVLTGKEELVRGED